MMMNYSYSSCIFLPFLLLFFCEKHAVIGDVTRIFQMQNLVNDHCKDCETPEPLKIIFIQQIWRLIPKDAGRHTKFSDSITSEYNSNEENCLKEEVQDRCARPYIGVIDRNLLAYLPLLLQNVRDLSFFNIRYMFKLRRLVCWDRGCLE